MLTTDRAEKGKLGRARQVLDAPQLQDDFYLNLVDWSSQNVLAVGLGTCVYLWSACTSKVGHNLDMHPLLCPLISCARGGPCACCCALNLGTLHVGRLKSPHWQQMLTLHINFGPEL